MDLSEDLLCLFTAEVEQRGESYVIEVPQREVDIGGAEPETVHRVAVFSSGARATQDAGSEQERGHTSEQRTPPVEEGEVVDVEVEDIGEQGDGIARVGPGYVVIVSETSVGDRVAVEITDVRANMAFAEVVQRYDR
jgi:predicted RNA-binding protein with TRAM domain